mgnify:CR=1 FL=1
MRQRRLLKLLPYLAVALLTLVMAGAPAAAFTVRARALLSYQARSPRALSVVAGARLVVWRVGGRGGGGSGAATRRAGACAAAPRTPPGRDCRACPPMD